MRTEEGGGRPARTFTVRVWSETTGAGVEHRGRVQELATGAYCSHCLPVEPQNFQRSACGTLVAVYEVVEVELVDLARVKLRDARAHALKQCS
jgi:hypothetical protein